MNSSMMGTSTMGASTMTWLLGGALVASLSWNALTLRHAETPAVSGSCGSCAASVERMIEHGALTLSSAQRAELVALMSRCDEESARGDVRAGELGRELRSLLRDPAADATAIRARARELGALRATAVESCIESALALRTLLTPEQAGRVLDACCGDNCCGE